MNHRIASLALTALTALTALVGALPAFGQNKQTVRMTIIHQSYTEAFGRRATDAEANYWNGRTDWSNKGDLVALHLAGMKNYPELQESAVKAAYVTAGLAAPGDAMLNFWKQDLAKWPRTVATLSKDVLSFNEARKRHVDDAYRTAFGRPASADEVKYWQTRSDWFAKPRNPNESLPELHRNYIRGDDAASKEVVVNSYVNALKRQPTADELAYWIPQVKRGLLASEVEAAHRDWFNKELKRIVSNPTIMAAISAKGLAIDVNGNLVTMESVKLTGNTIVAAGGGNIVAGGGGNIVAGGGGNIVAGGGGNIVAHVGGYLLGKGGAGLIGPGGSTIVAGGGGN